MRIVCLLIPAIVLASPPQRPAESPSAAGQVNLNVVALDIKGKSVMDLSAADFRVTDNGKAQTIASFRRRVSRPSPSVALGPRQYSNRFANAAPHATVILFDELNMQFADRGYVLNQLTHALQEYESSDNLYLYLITENAALYPVRGLPGEDAKEQSWSGDIQARLNEAMRATLGHRPLDIYFDIDVRVRATFSTLSIVAARLAGMPGRKNIVWLTHGIPIMLTPNRTVSGDWIDYTPYVRQLSDTLDRADVSIYAVQQSPPGSINTMDMSQSATTSGGRGLPGSAPADPGMAGMGSEQTLDEFANLTGGRAYQNNDIAGAIKQAVNDAAQSYLLSYTPPPENWDGKYHKIRITCTRKGVRLQTRQGYFAFAEQAASPKQADDAIGSAMTSPFDAAEIGLRATATPLAGDQPVMHVVLNIDPADVQLKPSGQSFDGQLATRFIEYLEDGSMRQSKPKSIDLHLTVPQHEEAMKKGFDLTEDIAVAPQVQRIRAIVFDMGSAAIGSLTFPAR